MTTPRAEQWTHVFWWARGPFGAGGPDAFDHNPVRAAAKGQRCRVLRARRTDGTVVPVVTPMGTVVVELESGERMATSYRALRRIRRDRRSPPPVDRRRPHRRRLGGI